MYLNCTYLLDKEYNVAAVEANRGINRCITCLHYMLSGLLRGPLNYRLACLGENIAVRIEAGISAHRANCWRIRHSNQKKTNPKSKLKQSLMAGILY